MFDPSDGEAEHLQAYHGQGDHSLSRIAIVYTKWHADIMTALVEGAKSVLARAGVGTVDLYIVPGSYELAYAANRLAGSGSFDAVICLGCIVRGETKHNVYISQTVADALMRVSLDTKIPVLFGVLTTENFEQAYDRAGGPHGNKGAEAAAAALDLIDFRKATESL